LLKKEENMTEVKRKGSVNPTPKSPPFSERSLQVAKKEGNCVFRNLPITADQAQAARNIVNILAGGVW